MCRLKFPLSEFVPETHKLMNTTEKAKFVNEVYKGQLNQSVIIFSFFLFIFLLCISNLICFNSIETVARFSFVLYFWSKAFFHWELFWVSQNWNWSSHVGQSERGRLIFESIRTLSKFIYRPKARENVCDQVSTGYSFAFDWSRRLGAFSRPIT